MHIHRKFLFNFFFSRSYTLFKLRNLAKMKDTTVFLVSATPLKSLNRITWNFVVMKDIMCRCAYPQEILIPFSFSELRSFWTLKFDVNERYYWNSWSAQLLWNRSTEFPETLYLWRTWCVDMHFYRKCWLDPFEEQFISPFFCLIARH